MEKRSFLAGLSVGRQLKGWGGSGSGLSLAPVCWMDSGVSTHFYIDYRYGIQNVSYGRFCNKTAIFGANGEIVPTEVEAVDSHTVKVYADLAGEVLVRVYGNAKAGLQYFDGSAVGAFSAELYPSGTAPYELPYLAESTKALPRAFGVEERVAVDLTETKNDAVTETAAYETAVFAAEEAASVSYA